MGGSSGLPPPTTFFYCITFLFVDKSGKKRRYFGIQSLLNRAMRCIEKKRTGKSGRIENTFGGEKETPGLMQNERIRKERAC